MSKEIKLSQGTIRYRDTGSGEPIVFLHGLLVDGQLWRKVTPELEGEFRCVVPDLPLGSHRIAVNADADLSPYGVAALVAELIGELGLERPTLVGNDSGGTICQILATRHPEVIGRLVLTPTDAFDNFPPKIFSYFKLLSKVPGGYAALAQSVRIRPLRRTPIAFGWLSKTPTERAVMDSWLEPVRLSPEIRRDVQKFIDGVDPAITRRTADELTEFTAPTLLAWAKEDKLFPVEHAHRLAELIPDARVVEIEDSYTFVSEDQPERLAREIAKFVRESQPAASSVS
ncbi:MAG: alpha/beta hydrolase [Thermoleophilaceae bacterium]|nr:alpha/beta hydrolase [Thermoleophilaceae bacterium]